MYIFGMECTDIACLNYLLIGTSQWLAYPCLGMAHYVLQIHIGQHDNSCSWVCAKILGLTIFFWYLNNCSLPVLVNLWAFLGCFFKSYWYHQFRWANGMFLGSYFLGFLENLCLCFAWLSLHLVFCWNYGSHSPLLKITCHT